MKIREIHEFESVKDDWNNILQAYPINDNIFLTWEWLSAWWKHFHNGKRLLILLLEENDQVQAIAPLMLSKIKLPFVGMIKKIEFLGTPHSDYHGFIVRKSEPETLRTVFRYLNDNFIDWDWIELMEVPESTQIPEFARRIIGEISNLKIKERVCNLCPYLPLSPSFDLSQTNMSGRSRRNLNRSYRKFREKYTVNLQRYGEAGFSVEQAMKTFFALHQERWSMENSPGIFRTAREETMNFHMDVAHSFAEKDWLGTHFLMANGEPVSALYSFEYNRRMFSYLTGFNPAYADYSVGNLTIMLCLEKIAKRGFREFDFMRGIEAYKSHFTEKYRRNFQIRLVRRDLSAFFYDFISWNDVTNKMYNRLSRTKLSHESAS